MHGPAVRSPQGIPLGAKNGRWVRIYVFLGLCVVVAAGGWWWANPLPSLREATTTGVALLVFVVVPMMLGRHMRRVARLRYLDGNIHQALWEWSWWRPLLEPSQYLLLRAGMLIQGELYDTAETLLRSPGLSPAVLENTRFSLYRNQGKHEEALAALDRALATPSEGLRPSFLVERACFLAEFFPGRLGEAAENFQEALTLPALPVMTTIFLCMEGSLLLYGAQPARAGEIFGKYLPELEELSSSSLDLLPAVGTLRRQWGRALWASGQGEAAREMLLKARDTFRGKRFQALVDQDLGNLRDGLELFPPPGPDDEQAGRKHLEILASRA